MAIRYEVVGQLVLLFGVFGKTINLLKNFIESAHGFYKNNYKNNCIKPF